MLPRRSIFHQFIMVIADISNCYNIVRLGNKKPAALYGVAGSCLSRPSLRDRIFLNAEEILHRSGTNTRGGWISLRKFTMKFLPGGKQFPVPHFPMQNRLNITPNKSSDVNSPVMLFKRSCASRNSSAIKSSD